MDDDPADEEAASPSLSLSPSVASVQSNHQQQQTARNQVLQAKLEKVLAIVTASTEELLHTQGLVPQYALRMTEDGALTPDNQLSVAEIKRRAHLSSCRYKVAVRVNGKVVTSTDYFKLRVASLSIDFKKAFEFRLFHQPQDITLDIYASKVHLLDPSDTLVASVSVPVPGLSNRDSGSGGSKQAGGGKQNVTHSYAPILGWYSFTANASAVAPSVGSGLLGGLFGGSEASAANSNGEFVLMRRTEVRPFDVLISLTTYLYSVLLLTGRGAGHYRVRRVCDGPLGQPPLRGYSQ